MTLTKAQTKVLEMIKAAGTIERDELNRRVHGKTLNSLYEKGLLEDTHHSRLRTDDMETVIWWEVSVK